MPDAGTVYAAVRQRLVALARTLDDEQAALPVAACPAWTVRDVYAHLAGTVTDVNEGRLEGVGSDPWTAAQVEARRDTTLAALADEWERGAPQFEAGLSAIGGVMAALAVADAWNHEQDLYGALGIEGGRDVEAEHYAIEGYAGVLGAPFGERGLGALDLVAGSHSWRMGDGAAGATVQAEPYELARMIAGRRTAEQMRSYVWDGDCDAYIAVLAEHAPAATLPT